jgi:hypothetical protein
LRATPWIVGVFVTCLAALVPASSSAIPTAADSDKSFYIFAIWDQIAVHDEKTISKEMDALIEQFGRGNAYHHIGFAFMTTNLPHMRLICRLAREKRLNLGVIIPVQAHTIGKLSHEFDRDLRNYQWRLSGAVWQGTGNTRDGREYKVPTPSRYCPMVQEKMLDRARADAGNVAQLMKEFPGVITVVNGVIEEELAVGESGAKGPDANKYLGDYSPYAITEFRDWLRHTGQYDGSEGAHAGEGAPPTIVGPLIRLKGGLRSSFYDDPDPATSKSGRLSFNQKFGTHFKTWKLRYWDLDEFPKPITDEKFNPVPSSGEGSIADGFDAPRKVDNSPYWTAWSWDCFDRKGYPPDNPSNPAFGFRQVMVAHFVQDIFEVAAAEGIPKKLLFPHQIPGELIEPKRCRSSASPLWTGYLPMNGNVGITRFGPINPQAALQYTALNPQSRNWGIFEWHPMPGAKPDDPELYEKTTKQLDVLYKGDCHYLFAGWWNGSATFPLKDSNMARAIKDFLASRPDSPYPGYSPMLASSAR